MNFLSKGSGRVGPSERSRIGLYSRGTRVLQFAIRSTSSLGWWTENGEGRYCAKPTHFWVFANNVWRQIRPNIFRRRRGGQIYYTERDRQGGREKERGMTSVCALRHTRRCRRVNKVLFSIDRSRRMFGSPFSLRTQCAELPKLRQKTHDLSMRTPCRRTPRYVGIGWRVPHFSREYPGP